MTEAADGPSQPTSYGGPAGSSVAATTRCVRWRRAGTRTRSGRSTSATTRRCIGIAARQTGAWEGLEEDRAVGGQPRCRLAASDPAHGPVHELVAPGRRDLG